MSQLKKFNTYQIQNPILPGFHPDPSLFRDDDGTFWISSNFRDAGIYNQKLNLTAMRAEGEAAGPVLQQNKRNQVRIERTRLNGRQLVRVVRCADLPDREPGRNEIPDLPRYPYHGSEVLAQLPWEGCRVVLRLDAHGQANSFYIGPDEDHLVPVAMNVDGSFLGSETSGGFLGVYIGLFATANGRESDNEAAFDWFSYVGKD